MDEAAAWIRSHLRIRYGGVFRLATDDILRAQAHYHDQTWRTGPAPAPAAPTAQAPRPDPTSSGTADDDVIDAEIVAPRCWSQLAPDEQQQIAEGVAATGRRLVDLPDADLHQLIADWISRTYRTDLTATDVAAAQAARDAQDTAAGRPVHEQLPTVSAARPAGSSPSGKPVTPAGSTRTATASIRPTPPPPSSALPTATPTRRPLTPPARHRRWWRTPRTHPRPGSHPTRESYRS